MLHILTITGPIFLLIGVGFVAVRTAFMSKADIRALGFFVIHFAIPAQLFKALSERPIGELFNLGYVLGFAGGSLAVLAAALAFAHLRQKKNLSVSGVFAMGASVSNSVFIGYPVAVQLVGSIATVALALSVVVENLLMLPLLLAVAESGGKGGARLPAVIAGIFKRLLRNPLIIGIAAGASFSALGIRAPAPIEKAIEMVAMASGALALFFIGGTLVGLKVRGMLADIGVITACKLLLHPLLVFAAFQLLPPVDPALQLAAVITAAVPMLSIYPILGQKFGQEDICAAALLATTVVSFFSLSALVWLVSHGAIPALRVGAGA